MCDYCSTGSWKRWYDSRWQCKARTAPRSKQRLSSQSIQQVWKPSYLASLHVHSESASSSAMADRPHNASFTLFSIDVESYSQNGKIVQCESKILPPTTFGLGIFNWNFAYLWCVQIYDRLPNFIQLSPDFTKLCCIKRDYPPNFKPIVTPEYQLFDYLLVTGSQSTWLSCVGWHIVSLKIKNSQQISHMTGSYCWVRSMLW